MLNCDWPVVYPTDAPCDLLAGDDEAIVAKRLRFEAMAAEYLWRYTARQFGTCEDVIRPCRADSTAGLSTYGSAPPGASPWQPVLVGGNWLNLSCGRHRSGCSCEHGAVLDLGTPVNAVTAVQVGPEILDPSAYRVDHNRLLVRQDGGVWPYLQDLGAPVGDADTWSVTVQVGAAVPPGGQLAAGKLACELAKAAEGSGKCELPQRWQSITRQGVSISAALDTFEGLDEGKTGIWLIDSWVASVTKSPERGTFSIASPDLRGHTRTTYGG